MTNIVISDNLRNLVDNMIIITKNSESSLGKLGFDIPIEMERMWFITSLVHSTIEKMLNGMDRKMADVAVYSYLKDLSVDCTEEELINTEEEFPSAYTLNRNFKILRGVMIRYISENIVWEDEAAKEVAATSSKVIPFTGRSTE